MDYHLELKKYLVSGVGIEIYVPDAKDIKQMYREGKISFPYWSQVWPSAIGLSEFLLNNAGYIRNKKVIELAAGLGLPSIIAARCADDVTCSDHDMHAVMVMKKTIDHHRLENCKAVILDWNETVKNIEADVVLMSDINYDPSAFAALKKVIDKYLSDGATVILSTPQRLMAKDFINEFLDCSIMKMEVPVDETLISVFVLRR